MPHQLGDNLAIESALVCDDDATARTLVLNYLKDLGVAQVDSFETGDLAWEAVQKKQYSLLVLDWKLPGLSGLALFNRIRQMKSYRDTPVLIISGFIDKDDFRLLQEIPLSMLMEKPFTKTLFFNTLEALFRESDWNLQNAAMIDSIMSAVEGDATKIAGIFKELLRKSPNPLPLGVLAARKLIKRKMLKEAERLLRSLLERDDASVLVMNELGKVLLLGGDHRGALDVLRSAHKMSPQNIQRLCLLGEAELNLQHPEEARAYFEKALELDGEHKKAQAGVVVAGNLENAGSVDDSLLPRRLTTSLASLLNTIGIALVRSGQFSRGVEQYRSALAFIHEKEDAARVAFNLGLGHLRWGRAGEALTWFQRSERLSPDGFAKSARYVKRLLATDIDRSFEQELPLAAEQRQLEAALPPKADGQSGDEKSNVIPFPAKSTGSLKPKAIDNEELEERVGGERVEGEADGGAVDADNFGLGEASDSLAAV